MVRQENKQEGEAHTPELCGRGKEKPMNKEQRKTKS